MTTSGDVLAYALRITFSASLIFVLITHPGYQKEGVLFCGGYMPKSTLLRKRSKPNQIRTTGIVKRKTTKRATAPAQTTFRKIVKKQAERTQES
jgi:cytochrome c-type biogenesis protein CcmE